MNKKKQLIFNYAVTSVCQEAKWIFLAGQKLSNTDGTFLVAPGCEEEFLGRHTAETLVRVEVPA